MLASAFFLSACDKGGSVTNDTRDGAVPGGTNQQSIVNEVGGGASPEAMPGVGAPGAGGAGTQPSTGTAGTTQ